MIAPLIMDPKLQGIPLVGQASGVRNLSYITFPASIPNTLGLFREIAPFDKVALLASASILEAIPPLQSHFVEAGRSIGVEVVPVPVKGTAATVLEALPADVDGVFIGLSLNLADDEVEILVQGLIELGNIFSQLTSCRPDNFWKLRHNYDVGPMKAGRNRASERLQ